MAKIANSLSRQASALLNWFDDRLPVTAFWNNVMTGYMAPKNFNFWYYMGSLALLVLVIQIFSGILLAMHYKPSALEAFASVEYIMRDVEWGWLIRYMHTTGASFFFILIYLHMFRSLLYGSHKAPRELLWVFGMFHLRGIDGRGIPWLYPAVGTDVVLGCAGYYQPVRRDSENW